MRIAIIGDLQNDTSEHIKCAIDDIKALKPDYVITLGDYGMYGDIGTYKSFSDIADAFKDFPLKKYVPLLGNHDVQHENGETKFKAGTIYKNYTDAFGFPPENTIIETENFAICCVHLNPQTKERYIHIHECTVADENFEHIKNYIESVKNKPIIMITHTPPACAELLCVPEVHMRATNAYLDQSHDYSRWEKLAYENRNILMWFSGHFHMGHTYKKSISIKDSLAYMTVGCPVAGSRDGLLHTRILDADDTKITVRTYDHKTKKLADTIDFSCPYRLRGEYIASDEPLCIGCGNVVSAKMHKNGTLYTMTDNGFLWETHLDERFTAGTIHYSNIYKLEDFMLGENEIYRICKDKMFCHNINNPQRFMREYDHPDCKFDTMEIKSVDEQLSTNFMFNKGSKSFTFNKQEYTYTTDDENKLWINFK